MRLIVATFLFGIIFVLLSSNGEATPTPTPTATATPTATPWVHQNVAIVSDGNVNSASHPLPVVFP